jgi:hypothetical protein
LSCDRGRLQTREKCLGYISNIHSWGFFIAFLKHMCLLFADEYFRETLKQNFGLGCAWYYALPWFSCDACLHHKQLVTKLFRDESMNEEVLHGLCGWMKYVGCPGLARANNSDISNFNLIIRYIDFVDCINQYAKVITDFALTSYGFHFLTSYELDRLTVMDIPPDILRLHFICGLSWRHRLRCTYIRINIQWR